MRRLVHYPEPAPGNKHGHAMAAISATVCGGMDPGWAAASPSVDFTDTTTTSLADDPAAWPERFTIAGLTYQRFELPQDAPPRPVWEQAARCAWLRRQSEFDSGPYEQAARVFRQHGYTGEAEQVLMAQRRHARQVGRPNATWLRRAMLARDKGRSHSGAPIGGSRLSPTRLQATACDHQTGAGRSPLASIR
jgi:hypothetical protein